MPSTPLLLDGSPLTPADVGSVARENRAVRIGPAAIASMAASRRTVESHLADGKAHYGINTGFGSLARQRIPSERLADLQRNLVRSHAAGVGPELPGEVVRGMMLLLVASLARGKSGVRPVVAERIAELLERGITPVVPETGSVGASGDLAPLAHVARCLIGEGDVTVAGRRTSAVEALRAANVQPVSLEAKEGLALINGTHLMAAQAALLVVDLERLLGAALIATAMSIDACRATDSFLDPRVYAARNHAGPAAAADALRALLAGSQIIPSHVENDPRVQDPYSFRCAPAVTGAVIDAFATFRTATERELGAVTDNPLVLGGDKPIVSAGNFHGMPIALPLDQVAIAIAHLAGISERRTFYTLSGPDGTNLPPFLTPKAGVNSGLMIAQYTAAACCNEIIGLAAPASVANLSTSAGMEDYNSFGPRAAAKARRACELATSVVAIELLCAAQGLEFHRPLRSGAGVERAHGAIRQAVPKLDDDRSPAPDIAAIAEMIRRGVLMA